MPTTSRCETAQRSTRCHCETAQRSTQSLATLTVALATLAALPAPASAQQVLTLGDAARLAAAQSPAAAAAKERAYQSGARAVRTRAELLPSLSSAALIDGGTNLPGWNGGTIPSSPLGAAGSNRTLDMQLRVTQKVFDLGALRRWRASAAEAEAAGAGAHAAAEAAAEDGALAYLRVLRADARLAARLADSSLAAELLDIARQQLAAGTAIALDVTRSESQLASAASQLIAGRSERDLARLELLRVLGLPIDTRVALGDSLTLPARDEVNVSEADAVKTAFTRRGDVLAASATVNAARRQVGAVRAERLPSVSLFGAAGSNADGVMDSHTYGIQVSVALFDGFSREARVAEGRAREREADAQAREVTLRTEVEVRSALLDLASAREQVAAAGVQLRLAEQEVAQARDRFRAGIAGNADVINASLTLNRARDTVVDALSAYHGARVELAAAQGATVGMR